MEEPEVEKLIRRNPKKQVNSKDYLSTGSTLLNLACSNRVDGGFQKGKYYFFVGDSAAGKTFAGLTALAEASISESFKDYTLVYGNAEDGALMDHERFFGKSFKSRVREEHLSTIEEFYYNLDDVAGEEKPFVYVLDSMDSLSSESAKEKFKEQKNAFKKGKEVTGSYGDGKAKMNSSHLRGALDGMRESGSILIIIAQTRDNIGFGAQLSPKTRSGGKALKFYATNELWFSVKERITRVYNGKKRVIGSELRVQVKKNRQTGREPLVDLSFYPSSGFDDVGSSINYLIEEKHWKGDKTSVVAPEFEFSGKKETLVQKIEEGELERELRIIVSEVWDAVEEACSVRRKSRYG